LIWEGKKLANPNDPTLDDFFNVLNNVSDTNYHSSTYLTTSVFCAEVGSPPTLPAVGITDHGPNFQGTADVKLLFDQLFTSFPDVALAPLSGAPRLYSTDGFTIGIQTTLTGTQKDKWFKHATGGQKDHYSPPLSDIKPDKIHVMVIPACAVFNFDNSNLITRLWLYLDRYRMQQQLTPPPSAAELSEVVSAFTRLSRSKT
jgi:hypothetical protein